MRRRQTQHERGTHGGRTSPVDRRTSMTVTVDVRLAAYLDRIGVLTLEPEAEQATPHEPFRLHAIDAAGYVMQARVGGEWRPLYRFDLTEQFIADYEVSNWYLCHHPQSHFLSGIMVGRPEPDRRYALGGTSLAVHHLDGPTERRMLESPSAIRTVLEETFLLD